MDTVVTEKQCNRLLEATRDLGRQLFGNSRGESLADTALTITDLAARYAYLRDLGADLLDSKRRGEAYFPRIQERSKYKFQPVDVRTFVCDDYYLGLGEEAYEPVLADLEEINSGQYVEAVLTGGIGSAKTTTAIWTNLYQIYLLSALHNPHREFGQDKSSEIVFIIQSIRKELAEKLDYARMRTLIENSPYFQEEFPFNKYVTSELQFPNRIVVKPVSGSETAAIGQNVIGGIIDELNYMAVVQKSKQSHDSGTYDQAVSLYNSISRRRKTRFMNQGKMPGVLCLVSSRKYPGQFTDTKEAERRKDIERQGWSPIYLYDKRVWDIKPHEFSGETFNLFVGNEHRKPRILESGEPVSAEEDSLIMKVPLEYKGDFERDIHDSLREIAGVATLALHPYMANVEAVTRCFSPMYRSVFSATRCDFVDQKVSVRPKAMKRLTDQFPRFVHIDLGITGDSAGLVVGHVSGFSEFTLEDTTEKRPVITIDGALEIAPPRDGEILFWKIRKLLYLLRDRGMPIEWVTFDSYQSRDSMQLLRQKGFSTGCCSVDTSLVPYQVTKEALYDGRVELPEHDLLQTELLGLEHDTQTGKVDHRVDGTKDVADALAGVVYGLTNRRKIYALHGVPLRDLQARLRETSEDETPQKQRGRLGTGIIRDVKTLDVDL